MTTLEKLQIKPKSRRGFASMPLDKIKEIARKGGQARYDQLGFEGYSKMGKKGGKARLKAIGVEGYIEMGKKGGNKSRFKKKD